MVNIICRECGWTSGPTRQSYGACPSCGKMYCLDVTPLNTGTPSSDSSSSGGGMVVLFLIAALVLPVLIFFPGILCTMFIDIWADFDSKFWCWVWTLLFSGLLFAFCGANWKAYLVVDIVLLIIFGILALCISKFEPFSWGFLHLYGMEF